MKLWISKSSEVPIQEQLVTQLILGIVSADLAAQEKLPSTTQLGRRFRVHPNTVRAAYRELVDRGWVEWRAGSGFYVRSRNGRQKLDPSLDLDHLISTFLEIARRRGFSLSEIQKRIGRWLAIQEPDHIVVIEPDPELRAILISEIKDHVSRPVVGVGILNMRKKCGRLFRPNPAACFYDLDRSPGVCRTKHGRLPTRRLRSFRAGRIFSTGRGQRWSRWVSMRRLSTFAMRVKRTGTAASRAKA